MLTGRSLATTARTVALAVVLTAASVVAGLLLPEQVHGQGYNPIRVIHQGQELTFPDRFRLTLTAESERSITRVQVNYRPRGSSIWSYASPDIAPARRVTATFATASSTAAPSSPPGTLIEYYWSIEDAAGNSRETAPDTLRYADNRFDWQEDPGRPPDPDVPQPVRIARARQVARRVEAELAGGAGPHGPGRRPAHARFRLQQLPRGGPGLSLSIPDHHPAAGLPRIRLPVGPRFPGHWSPAPGSWSTNRRT